MNLDRLNAALECTSSVKSVGELDGFPFQHHAEFVDAYKARRVDIPSRFSTWSVMRFLNSWNDTLWFVFIFNGFALAIGATVYAILQHDYWYLLGLPIGWACVNSANARLTLIDMFFWLPVFFLGLVLLPFTSAGGKCLLILSGMASVSKIVSHVGVGAVVMEIEQWLSESELLLARLYSDGYITIYDKERKLLFDATRVSSHHDARQLVDAEISQDPTR